MPLLPVHATLVGDFGLDELVDESEKHRLVTAQQIELQELKARFVGIILHVLRGRVGWVFGGTMEEECKDIE